MSSEKRGTGLFRGKPGRKGDILDMRIDMNDTIAAVATAVGDAGIGLIRISGPDAVSIGDAVFAAKHGRPLSSVTTHTVQYGWVRDSSGAVIDEVLVTVMRAPRSYTREDVVEIGCHGGMTAVRAVLERVVSAGARIADPGEFTKRAFLHGRIDLAQAEAVLDIIRAKTDRALRAGEDNLRGFFSSEISRVRERLISVLAKIEASIDFPDEEIGRVDREAVEKDVSSAAQDLDAIALRLSRGRILRDGIRVVICGRPNVGKSSLLNALLKKERSIVTPIAGTTRDIVEDVIDIRGIPVRIMDTAGLLKPRGIIEKKAVSLTRACISDADIVIVMIDSSRRMTPSDEAVLRRVRGKKKIVALNKCDLPRRLSVRSRMSFKCPVVEISAKNRANIGALEDAIFSAAGVSGEVQGESVLVGNMRQARMIDRAAAALEDAKKVFARGLTAEWCADALKAAIRPLDEILGKEFSEEMLDTIFDSFCIGK